MPRGDFGRLYGADAADVELLTRTVAGLGARVVEVDQASRRVRLSGTVAVLSRMFGSSLELVTAPAPSGTPAIFRQRTGGLSVPAALDGVVTAVLGLDDRPQAIRYWTAAYQFDTSSAGIVQKLRAQGLDPERLRPTRPLAPNNGPATNAPAVK